jgi:tetratricopeptide (TPR) repeat protein
MARWNSVNRWSNRFASLEWLVLVAACQGSLHAATPAAADNAPPAAAAVPIAAPVPPQAAQRYADALALMKAGRSTDAERAFKELNSSYPQFAGPDVNLGLIYLQGSRLPEAEAAFKEAVSRNPANAVAGNELGIVERRMGKFAEAEAAYQRTIAAEPDYAPAYLNLGVLYDLYMAEPKKALEQFEHYLRLSGDNKQVSGWVIELRKRVGAPTPKQEPA